MGKFQSLVGKLETYHDKQLFVTFYVFQSLVGKLETSKQNEHMNA